MNRDVAWLRERVSFLAETPEDALVLDRVLARVTGVQQDDRGTVEVAFAAGGPWVISPPRPSELEVPESLAHVLRHCEGMSFDEVGTVSGLSLHDGWSGTLSVMGEDLGPREERDGFGCDTDPCAPIDVGLSSYYLFHPVTGELCHYDHEGGVESIAPGSRPAGVFLRELLEALECAAEA